MKNLIYLIFLFSCTPSLAADVTIGQLPLGSASTATSNDSFPYVNSTTNVTQRLTLYDLINLPAFTDTYAPIASPTFTGTVTAPTFVGAVTGTSSGNTTYTANNHGVVISSATNAMTVLAPSSSTSFPLISGGSGSSPSWAALGIAGGGTGQVTQNASFNALSPLSTLGDTLYENSTPAGAALAGNTTATKKFLTQTGTGTVSAAPAWNTVANTDLSGITNTQLSGTAAISNANLATMTTNTVKANITGSTAVPTDVGLVTPATASTAMFRNSQSNVQANNIVQNLTSTATAAATTTLTVASSAIQVFTGSLNQTVALPVASTLLGNGFTFTIQNQSTGTITVQTSGANTLLTLSANQQSKITCVNTAGGTGVASWNFNVTATTASSGAGAKNYLSAYTPSTSSGVANVGNGNFELGSTTGWALGTIGTLTNGLPTGTPTFGSGAAGTLSIATVSSGQLANAYSMSYVSSAATTAGNMVSSNAFFIDTEDQAKVLTWKIYYTASSGTTNVNWSGTSSNSYAVAVYDVTNSAWLPIPGAFGMTQSSGVGYATGTVQTAVNTTQLRFVIYNATATAGAATLVVDDIAIGPQTAPFGPAMTDWQTYTPTGTWVTNSTYTGQWRRVGDSMEIMAAINLTGAPTATTLEINIPTGYSINTAKIAGISSGNVPSMGTGNSVHSGSASQLVPLYFSTSAVLMAYNSTVTTQAVINATSPVTWASGDIITMHIMAPITGWSSNVQMSSDTDTRVVAMQVSQAAPTATITGSYSLVKYTGGVLQDTHGGFSTTTGLYTVPVTGFYRVTAAIGVQATYTAAQISGSAIYHNGTPVYESGQQSSAGTGVSVYPSASGTIYCLAGDTLAPYVLSSGTSPTIANQVQLNYFTVERLSGPEVIAATESVNMSYSDTSGQTMSSGVYLFPTKNYDTHNAYNTTTGIYTIPVSGKYRMSAAFTTVAVSFSTTQSLTMQLWHNSSPFISAFQNGGGASTNHNAAVSGTVNCLAGDTLQVEVLSSVSTTAFTTSGYNNLSIERVGN